MRLLVLIGLICLAGYYWKEQHGGSESPSILSDFTVQVRDVRSMAQAREIIFSGYGPKAVAIAASWCPACNVYLPQFAALSDLPYGTRRYAILIDTRPGAAQQYAQKVGGDITWLRLSSCRSQYCTEQAASFKDIGISYRGSVPTFAVYDRSNRLQVQGLPVDTIPCALKGSCIVSCQQNGACRVQKVR